MSISKRKIGYYSLTLIDRVDNEIAHPMGELKNVIQFISHLSETDRIRNNTVNNKFYFLKSVRHTGECYKIIFKSGKYNHRPPLIDRNTADERDNPKTLDEGESESTHLFIRFSDDSAKFFLEERKAGLCARSIVAYFKHFARQLFSISDAGSVSYIIDLQPLAKSNFLQELRKLKTITMGEIQTDKALLGKEALNYSERLQKVRDKISIVIKPNYKESLREVLEQIFRKFTSNQTNIIKIRAQGKSVEGNDVMLDTEMFRQIEHVEVDLVDETGLVDSNDLFDKLGQLN